MATTNPSLKRSPGQIYRWRTRKKKWFFYITHLKCWRTTENTNLVAFCPWDYWTLLQGDFLKSLVISSFPTQYRKGISSSLFVLTGYHHHLVKVLLGENWLRQSGTRIWSECKKLKETCFSWILNIATCGRSAWECLRPSWGGCRPSDLRTDLRRWWRSSQRHRYRSGMI